MILLEFYEEIVVYIDSIKKVVFFFIVDWCLDC